MSTAALTHLNLHPYTGPGSIPGALLKQHAESDPERLGLALIPARNGTASRIGCALAVLDTLGIDAEARIALRDQHGWPRVTEIMPELAGKTQSRSYASLKIRRECVPDETHLSSPW